MTKSTLVFLLHFLLLSWYRSTCCSIGFFHHHHHPSEQASQANRRTLLLLLSPPFLIPFSLPLARLGLAVYYIYLNIIPFLCLVIYR